jgi:hypothetical protein
MPQFLAIRSMPGVTPDALAAAGAQVKTCVAGMQSEGVKVRWLRSLYLPESSQTHCYFEGPTVADVVELNRRAGLPYERIVPVAEMTPNSV